MLGSSRMYIDNCMNGTEEEVIKSNSHTVMQFDHQRFCFLVQEIVHHNDDRPTTHYNVDLRNLTCECGRFQTFHVPCSHVITACSSIRQDYSMHIADVFKVVNVFKVYEESFLGILTETTRPQYEGDTLCHNESMRRKKKGRLNSCRIRTEMDNVKKEKRRCGICREIGHMHRKCSNMPDPST
ncbi:uncharacterized protein LOC127093954 [Lathyrus oleraceus]|uniref:uncharacterized protein LOC127093954 n=1 Tax=Pisum sativum TaxID=3888 RepID=UPI0021CF3202|nr:uncharacterized protein LOC127093954 [Pisum sativum]